MSDRGTGKVSIEVALQERSRDSRMRGIDRIARRSRSRDRGDRRQAMDALAASPGRCYDAGDCQLAGRHPSGLVPHTKIASNYEGPAGDPRLLGKNDFFVKEWVPFGDRQNFLLEADIGLSADRPNPERDFAFRTRLVDYLWARLPIATSMGDVLASLVEKEWLGIVALPEDLGALARGCRKDPEG